MSRYVDGFVLVVPNNRLDDYKQMAEKASVIWKEHGALEYSECVGDDLDVPEGGPLSFPQMASSKPDETVIFAWVTWESREARDTANKKIAHDPRMAELMDPDDPVFDCTRMAFGGFAQLVQA